MKLILAIWIFAFAKVQAQAIYQEDIFRKNDLNSYENRLEAVYYSAKKVAAQVATEYGLDHELYFSLLEKNFQQEFQESKKIWLKDITGLSDDSQITPEIIEGIAGPLSHFESMERMKYSRLIEMINKENISNEEKDEYGVSARVELDVDKEAIKQEMSTVIRNQNKKVSDLLLMGDLRLHGFDWSSLGATYQGQFIAPILTAWKNKLEEHNFAQIERIQICKRYCLAFNQTWITQKQNHPQLYDIRFHRGLFLNFSGDFFGKIDVRSNVLILHGQGRFTLREISTKRNLISTDFVLPEIRIELTDKQHLSSMFATAIYQSGLSSLKKINKMLNHPQLKNKISRFSIEGFERLDDVLIIMDELKRHSLTPEVELKLECFDRTSADVIVFYSGVEKMFSDLFQRIKRVKLSQSYKIIYEFDGIHHVLRLVKN